MTVGEVQATEEERIAQAIDGKGEFLSDEGEQGAGHLPPGGL